MNRLQNMISPYRTEGYPYSNVTRTTYNLNKDADVVIRAGAAPTEDDITLAPADPVDAEATEIDPALLFYEGAAAEEAPVTTEEAPVTIEEAPEVTEEAQKQPASKPKPKTTRRKN